MRVLIFGDSITHGLWDENGGWVQRLAAHYNTRALLDMTAEHIDIYNLGIGGNTARDILRRLPYEVKSRGRKDEQPVIVIAIGINDTMVFKGAEATPPDIFMGELQELVASAREFTDKLLFVGLTAVDDDQCNPWQYSSTGKCFTNDRIQAFDVAIRNFCKTDNIPFADVFSKFKKQSAKQNMLADGLHPSAEGHALLAKIIKLEMDKIVL